VGAHVIGELAWSVENMLNKLIEETISISPQMLGLMDRVIDALPELIDCQEQGTLPNVDVARLEQDAFTLAEGKIPEDIPLQPVADTSAGEEVEELELSAPETPSEEMDLSETVDEISLIEPSSVLDESENLVEMELPDEVDLEQPLPHELEDDEISLSLDSDISGLSDFTVDSVSDSDEEVAPTAEVSKGETPAFDDSDLDVEVDSELLNIFGEESEVHLKEIESFLQIAVGSEPPVLVNEEVARACHTLRGSANMAGVLPIARLSETMETYTRTLFEQRRTADAPVTELLGSSVSCIRELLAWLPGDSLPEPPYEACLDRLQSALSELSGGVADEISEAAASEVELDQVDIPADEVGQPWDLDEVSSLTGLTVDSESLGDISTLSELIPPDEDNQYVVDEDEELIDIFVEESRELLENLDRDFDKWTASPDDTGTTDEIKRALHTLKGSSRLAGINPVGDLSHGLETLFNRMGLGQVEFSEPLSHLVREALDHLASQTDQAAAFRRVALADDLMDRLEQASQAESGAEAEEVIDPQLQRELEEADEAGESSQLSEETGAADYYEEPLSFIHEGDLFEFDGDPEMVEIFTEEARELLSSLDESHAVWTEKRDDVDALDEIQRALHTLKGSSRLAGLAPVGDLSHALESVMAAVSLSKLDPTDEVAGASREALDLLATQTDAAESKSGIPQAEALIKRLNLLLEAPAFEQESIDPQLERELEESAQGAGPEVDLVELEASVPAESEEISLEGDALSLSGEETAEGDETVFVPNDDLLLELGEDDELVQIFIEEAKEFVEQIDTHYQSWMEQTDDLARIEGIQRNLHTLKGSSRLAGIMPVGDLSHAVESLMTALAQQEVDPLPVVTDAARQAIDFLAHQIETIASIGKVPASEDLVEGLHSLLGGELETAMSGMVETIQVDQSDEDEPVEAEPAEEEEQPQQTAEIIPLSPNLEALLSAGEAQEKEEGAKRKKEQVRVNSELMDRLVNHAGEVSIYRARLEQQNSVLGFNLTELEQTVSRLYGQLRSLEIETEAQILYRWDRETENSDTEMAEFDPLEMDRFSTIQQLSRALAETVNDLGNINESLSDLQRETDTLLLQQSRISTDLQDGLLRTRMVPFAQLVPRLQRLVRQTANQLDKKANLECYGTEGELDRGILNRMIPVFEHLLRNSVSHGIEKPADREADGKPESGRISLYVDREANDVLITLSDDGKGLDIEAIRKRALENGVIDADAEISDDDLIQCVLIPGFSTAKEVTQISGRGVGLDVVTSEVKQLGGSLEIDSQPGRGTSFIIRLPLTLAITDALLMRVGDEICAIPHGSVEGVVRVRRKELMACYSGEQDGYVYAGKTYKVDYLGRMMGIGQHELPDTNRWFPLLLVQSGEHQVAIQVDELLGTRQVVVKSLGKQVGSVRWITGGTILADGRVALILDLSALVRMDATHVPGGEVERAGERKRAEERLRVMVVDDSITVRKVTSRLLERNDMEVITAKDGVEAVTMLQEQVPDIMLLDIEMPRMDGFELARHINNSVDYYGLPIIMISSRVGDKHRQRAFDLGVKRCLGKPYQEAELLDSINEVLAEARR
jgi:chemosensory pili system protein ChpA (sensor histidine kinase/response regulator)